jgi:hypothetical protein
LIISSLIQLVSPPQYRKDSSSCKSDGGTVPTHELGNNSQEPRNRSPPLPPQAPQLIAPPPPLGRPLRRPPRFRSLQNQDGRRGQVLPPPTGRISPLPPPPPPPPPLSRFSPPPSLPSIPTPRPREPMTIRTNPLTHARMYAVADFYGVLGLKKLANKKFRDAAREHWDSNDFAKAVEVVYTTTTSQDRGLRRVVKYVLVNHNELLDKPEIEKVVKEAPDLAYDILRGIRGIQDEDEDDELEGSGVTRVQCATQ